MTAPQTPDTKSALDILLGARARLEKPEAWTKRAYGRNADGVALPTSELNEAVCFCAVGAIRAESPDAADGSRNPQRAVAGAYLYKTLNADAQTDEEMRPVATFNDNVMTRHTDVLWLFDSAIQKCRADQPTPPEAVAA